MRPMPELPRKSYLVGMRLPEPLPLAATCSLCVLACDPADPSSDGRDSTTGDVGVGSAPATTTPFVTTSTPTSGDPSTGSSSGSEGTGDWTTSGGSDGADDEPIDEAGNEEDEPEGGRPHPGELACDLLCEAQDACALLEEGSDGDCYWACVDAYDPYVGQCIDAMSDLNGCLAELSCDDLAQWQQDPTGVCTDWQAALQECEP